MAFAYRVREAFIELNPGESGAWRLPPMTPGTIVIGSYYAMPPGWSASSGGGGGTSPHAGHGFHHDVTGVLIGGVEAVAVAPPPLEPIHLDQPHHLHLPPTGTLGDDLTVDPGDVGGSFGPTMELTLELLRGGQPMANALNHIAQNTPHSGDIWSLRVTRKQDGSLERRRYRIHIQYPSVLPLETRRIPVGFFTRGFSANWNDNPYLDWIQLRDDVLSYQWKQQFALLYGKPTDNQHVPLGVDFLKLPDIKAFKITVLAGSQSDAMPLPPGQIPPDRVYFALRIDAEYLGSHIAELDLRLSHPPITLPSPLWFEARFLLTPMGQGVIGYYPKVLSPLLDELNVNVTYPTLSGDMKTVNVKQEMVKAIENHLYQMQFGPQGNIFDQYLRPWLVGRYECAEITFDTHTKEVVVIYVGRQKEPKEPQLTVAVEGMSGGGPGSADPTTAWPRLYDTPFEMPIPAPTAVDPGEHLHHGADPGALNTVKHIVVLMQENRSFDQVLGYLSRDGMLPRDRLLSGDESTGREAPQAHVNGLLPGDSPRDAIRYPEMAGGQIYRPRRSRTTAWPSFGLDNPCHGHACVERQISDAMKGFIADYARKGMGPSELQLIMTYLTDAELPTYGALTREFAICDAWFCSHIGGTLPNRFISLTGDFSEDVYGSPEVENPDLASGFEPLEAKTFFDHLTARGVSWKLFEHNYSMLRLVRNFTFDETHIVGFEDHINGFVATAKAGHLPEVTFIEPDYIEMPDGNDDHAPADMLNGQRLIAKIVGALLDGPEDQWNDTLLIITYDEHGGFYDHEPLPSKVTTLVNGVPATRDIPPLATGERRLGVRVPAFIISPYIPAMPNGNVNVAKTIYEHTTIPATILRRFCGPFPPMMSPRTLGAADVRDILTLDTPRSRSEFKQLREELRQIENRPQVPATGTNPAAPLRWPKASQLEDDFPGLVAFASSITGLGHR
jgi:phospholipase C